jgi:hypothetical protein
VALLTASERRFLNHATPANWAVDLGRHLADAGTLQCPGDTATSHVRLAATPQPGDLVALIASGATGRDGRWAAGSNATYEFTATGQASPGNVPVLIGSTAMQTASNLAAAMQAPTMRPVVTAEAHPLDAAVDVTHNTYGAALRLSSVSGGRLVTQDNREELAPAEFVFILRRRTITAEDVARGRLRFDTGWSQIIEGFASLYRSSTDQTPENFNGTITTTAGVLELTQGTGTGTWSAGSVLQLQLLGMR